MTLDDERYLTYLPCFEAPRVATFRSPNNCMET